MSDFKVVLYPCATIDNAVNLTEKFEVGSRISGRHIHNLWMICSGIRSRVPNNYAGRGDPLEA